jgi:hypothetical protein
MNQLTAPTHVLQATLKHQLAYLIQHHDLAEVLDRVAELVYAQSQIRQCGCEDHRRQWDVLVCELEKATELAAAMKTMPDECREWK